jgi:hypothetical protein
MATEQTFDAKNSRGAALEPEWFKIVRAHVDSLKFGTVQVTVHDSKVVQIERVEKTRLDRLPPHG